MNKSSRVPWSKQTALNLIFFATLALFAAVNTALAAEPTNSANKVEIVMDCKQATYGGTWASGFRHRFTGSGIRQAYASFRPDLPVRGNYEIYEWRSIATRGRQEDARYEIRCKDGSKTIQVNQQIHGQQWNLLGVFPFDAGTNGEVRIDAANAPMGQMLVADTVTFVLPKTNVPPPTAAALKDAKVEK